MEVSHQSRSGVKSVGIAARQARGRDAKKRGGPMHMAKFQGEAKEAVETHLPCYTVHNRLVFKVGR